MARKKERLQHDVKVDNFATISGIKGRQFGKDVFTTVIPFKDLVKFLQVFPDVQRELNRRKVNSIKRYTLSGIEDENVMRFFPGVTATARGHIFYDENTHKIAIDVNNSKLSINDGQHRYYGINDAIREIQAKINKCNDEEELEELQATLTELREMVIPLVIFSNISETEEKQLFHDVNNLSSRPSRSATIRLAQTDVVSCIARDLAESNEYFLRYGVEYDKMSIQKENPNRILLTTIFAGIKLMFKELIKYNRDEINNLSQKKYTKIANDTFNEIFKVLPQDLHIGGKYIIEKSYALQGICSFVNYCRYVLEVKDESVMWQAIEKVDWTPNVEYWSRFNAVISRSGNLTFGASGGHGKIAVTDALLEQLPSDIYNGEKKLKVKDDAPEGQTTLAFE